MPVCGVFPRTPTIDRSADVPVQPRKNLLLCVNDALNRGVRPAPAPAVSCPPLPSTTVSDWFILKKSWKRENGSERELPAPPPDRRPTYQVQRGTLFKSVHNMRKSPSRTAPLFWGGNLFWLNVILCT